ncbi:MAG: succinate CoA transferase [Pirellulaceae bacterium]|nr:succinate CoA transferase [Pirellulaceae bacterium]
MMAYHGFPVLQPDDVAERIPHGALVGFSGFTPAGVAKAVPAALARRARAMQAAGHPYQLRVLTGASTGTKLDDVLADAKAISWRAPYQSSARLRDQINAGEVNFVDMHLSHVPQYLMFGFFGKLDYAVIEATEVTPDGRVYLSTSIGASPAFLHEADNVVIELNRAQSRQVSEMADIVVPKSPPYRPALDLDHPLQRIGKPYVRIDPERVIGVVETDEPDESVEFPPVDPIGQSIANHVVEFLVGEVSKGRVPRDFLRLQSGVGNVANAVLRAMGEHPDIPNFTMYTEVFQASALELMRRGRLTGASTTALVLSRAELRELVEHIAFFSPRIVLRPQDISNNPAAVRQLGVIAMNTALEVDIFGHVNSTHVCGGQIMNGIGGSGDFARNAYLSIFMCPSSAKGGAVSTIVPMCTHVDHSEHSVKVLVTEHGLADLRGLAPRQRALAIINQCAHPAYRDYLRRYLREAGPGHIQHDLRHCFELHQNYLRQGTMLPADTTARFPESNPATAGPHLAIANACEQVVTRPMECRHRRQLDDGTLVVLRPIRPDDEAMMVGFHQSLSQETVQRRYFGLIRLDHRVRHERLTRICTPDPARELVLIAEHRDDQGSTEILGVARLNRTDAPDAGEFAVVVRDAWQGRGLGTTLLETLVEIAFREGVRRVVGTVLPENSRMLAVCRRLGFRLTCDASGGEVRTTLDLAVGKAA